MSEQNNVTSYSDDDECIFRVQQFPNLPTTNINVDGLSVPVVIDSGATVNIADIDTYYKLRTLRKVEIMPSNIRLFTYGSTIPLNILGTITAQDIDIAHRVSVRSSSSNEGKPKPIICKFVRRLSKESVMKLRKEAGKIKSSDLGFNATLDIEIAIFDHLTPKAQKLLYEAKKFKARCRFAYCWTKNNQVYLREHENSHTYKISDLQDLRRLESSTSAAQDQETTVAK